LVISFISLPIAFKIISKKVQKCTYLLNYPKVYGSASVPSPPVMEIEDLRKTTGRTPVASLALS